MWKNYSIMEKPRVLLVSMPWASYQEPSLGLSILSSVLTNVSIENDVRYFNIFLLKYLKASTYSSLADIQGINEFLFSGVFEKNISSDQIQVLDRTFKYLLRDGNGVSKLNTRAEYFDFMLKLRNEVIPKYLNDCLNVILENQYSMIGFTCMFDQTIANLALAKLVKQRIPQILICFGGYALEGIVGYQILNSFNFVDIVVQGDGEPTISELAFLSVGQQEITQIPNIIYRDKIDTTVKVNKRIKIQLKDSPDPNYQSYFKNLEILKQENKVEIRPNVLSIESSRGCWWGEKSHCVFCGIDDDTLKYRQKSSELAVDMFYRMYDKYPNYTFRLVDYILPYKYFKSVLPVLADDNRDLKISCEMKSNITYHNFSLLKNAGFVQVQPGIESFSTNALKSMKKGVSGIQNILTLKLGKLLGLKIDWNFLYGFPDDRIEDYRPLIKTIPLLYHFDPPHSCTNVLITRFAPLQTTPEKFGIQKSKAHMTYETIFSEKYRKEIEFELDNFCYIFKTNWSNSDELEFTYRLIDSQVNFWKSTTSNANCKLEHQIFEDSITFTDNRLLNNEPRKICLGRLHSIIYQSIDTEIKSKNSLIKLFSDVVNQEQIDSILKELIEHRIVYQENEKYLGLSIKRNANNV
jgi:ribosomal peptide maturation radical SAM protein 1